MSDILWRVPVDAQDAYFGFELAIPTGPLGTAEEAAATATETVTKLNETRPDATEKLVVGQPYMADQTFSPDELTAMAAGLNFVNAYRGGAYFGPPPTPPTAGMTAAAKITNLLAP